MGLNYIAFALILLVGYVRITPGPQREIKEAHKFEREAFKRTAESMSKILKEDKGVSALQHSIHLSHFAASLSLQCRRGCTSA